MQILLGVAFFIALVGFVHSVAAGLVDQRESEVYGKLSDPTYYKRATFFAFAAVVLFTVFLQSLR